MDYHAGRLKPLQTRLVEEWLQEPGNEVVFYETLFEWEATHLQYHADTDAALEKYRLFLEKGTGQVAEEALARSPSRFFRWGMGLAAAVTLVLSAWIFRHNLFYRTYETGFGQMKRIVLPEGSAVTLNAHSRLRFPRFDFGSGDREVRLDGEAQFSVVHTADHRRFVVRTERNVDVEVLGTEFVVFNRQRATRVVLVKGKVKLAYHPETDKPREIMMRPGDQFTLDAKGYTSLETRKKPEDAAAWADHKYIFNDTPLREIADLIRENYGYEVRIASRRLGERVVSGTFEAASGDELLNVLQELLNIRVVRQGKHVTFSEKSK